MEVLLWGEDETEVQCHTAPPAGGAVWHERPGVWRRAPLTFRVLP